MSCQENLSEDQNRRLNQNARRGAGDAFAKPNITEKEKIDRIVQRVGHQMSVEEIDILYRCLFIVSLCVDVCLPSQRDEYDALSYVGKCQLTCVCRYRYSLTENKKALTKFLFAVNWDEESEVSVPSCLCF